MNPRVRLLYVATLCLAAAWAIWNAFAVYVLQHGERAYRVESAVFIALLVALPRVLAAPTKGTGESPGRTGQRLLVAFAVLLWLAVCLPVLRVPFLSDDYVFLGDVSSVGDLFPRTQFFRPAFLACFLALRFASDSPVVYHVASLLLHLASASLVYSLARVVLASRQRALVTFVVFLLNPLQPEAVAWISGLQDLLWTFFTLLGLRCHVAVRGTPGWRSAATLASIGVALLAKETAVCAILLLPAIDLARAGWEGLRRSAATYAALVGLIVVYLVVRRYVVGFESGFLFWPSRYFLKELLARPYAALSRPWNLTAVDVPPFVRGLATLLVLVPLLATVILGRASRRILLGPFVILASTLPVWSYLFVGADLSGSRYLYFAGFGWGMLLAEVLAALVTSQAWLLAAAALLATALGVSLHLNLRPWQAAGELVARVAASIAQGQGIQSAVEAWRREHPGALDVRDGRPYAYEGVNIFANGFQEFERRARLK